jgi:hypothetical protein
VKAALDGRPAPYDEAALAEVARHCTSRESAGRAVERQVRKTAAALVLAPRAGETFDAVVTGTKATGTYVRLVDPPAEGRVVEGEAGLDVGDRVRVRLVAADAARGFLDFAAGVAPGAAAGSPAPRRVRPSGAGTAPGSRYTARARRPAPRAVERQLARPTPAPAAAPPPRARVPQPTVRPAPGDAGGAARRAGAARHGRERVLVQPHVARREGGPASACRARRWCSGAAC